MEEFLRVRQLFRCSIIIALCSCVVASARAEEGYRDLFNGKDLTGWDGNPELWSVQDGLLTGTTKGQLKYNQFLVWTGGQAGDFELKLDFRFEGDSNSGVQYRSRRRPELGDWVVSGYQADIHPNPPYTAMLYEEKGRGILCQRGQKVVISAEGKKDVCKLPGKFDKVDLEKWHELVITCQGTHLVHRLDGVVVVDVTDDQSSKHALDGVIALQLHVGPAAQAQFRNIRLKDLKPVKDAKTSSVEVPAAQPAQISAAKDFQVDLLYSVPREQQGSWVNMCVDPKGRLIVSDQYGGLFRVTPPGIEKATTTVIEKIDVPLGEAQGLLWAFDSLYVVVNHGEHYETGVYRVRDTNNDDKLDHVELLRSLTGKGEHGPHAILLSPDGKSLYLACGNRTEMTKIDVSHVPALWDEDVLLPRIYGKGFMKGVPPPAGYVAKMSPDGKHWELITVGFRNEYDAAFNADGELFAYDADMEWDFNTPWYRPTRVCQVLSGVDYGWRNGSAKFPEYYADTMPPVVNIGPGSPTGICFGYGAKFPGKYQRALFLCDWSFGKLYAVELTPEGAGYIGKSAEFISGTPLPFTDVVINPVDHAMYFTVGGRKIQSGLFRVTYHGSESTAPVDAKNTAGAAERAELKTLQKLHSPDHPEAVDVAWPYLSHADRVLRSAARTAIEFRPRDEWATKALNEQNVQAKLESLLALCRSQTRATKKPDEAVDTPVPEWDGFLGESLGAKGLLQIGILTSLSGLDFTQFTPEQRLEALRAVQLALLRFGQPEPEVRDALLQTLGGTLPTKHPELNSMILEILVYLQSPEVAAQGLSMLLNTSSQDEQISYAKSLSYVRHGWTPRRREQYFNWFNTASGFRGGASFELYVEQIREEALKHLSQEEREALKPILDQKPEKADPSITRTTRPFVKDWTQAELLPILQAKLRGRDFEHGRQLFAAANCFACHRFNGEGGALGPDLTGLAGRFDVKAILESVVEPSKVISDQYAAVQIQTTDGRVLSGLLINVRNDQVRVTTDLLNPLGSETLERNQIETMIPSKTSMMPKGLLNTLHEDEILDLMAFLLSRGDRSSSMFQAKK